VDSVKLLANGKRKMVALIAGARKLLIRLNSLLATAEKKKPGDCSIGSKITLDHNAVTWR
jgi:hypothetical protein